MGQKKGFSLERHKEVGEYLKKTQKEFTSLCCEVSCDYPIDSNIVMSSLKLCRDLTEIRSHLEDAMVTEGHIFKNDSGLSIYFGVQKAVNGDEMGLPLEKDNGI